MIKDGSCCGVIPVGCMQWKLDNKNIQRILDSFAAATGIAISYFDEEENNIISGEKTHDNKSAPFCQRIHELPSLRKGCVQCDLKAFEAASSTKHACIYKCHMNLLEGVVPLHSGDRLVGYFFIGKYIEENDAERTWGIVKRNLQKAGLPETDIPGIYESYQEVPFIRKEKLESAGVLLEMLAAFIVDYEYIRLAETGKVDSIKKYIKKNLDKHLSLADIAGFHDISIPYMSTLFKKTTGMTINSYINQQRLERAKYLLTSTSLSMKEISAEIGYDNQNYFSRVFKKHMQISASEYREKNFK